MVNYYRDMWVHHSELLLPLTKLTSSKQKFVWTDVKQTTFDNVKKLMSKEVMLAYPDFNKPFVIHTDASHLQLGSVISQNGKPIAFYSRKLNPAQTRYTTTEQELLSIVEMLKEFRNIPLGQVITIYTDHQNLTYKAFNTEHVLHWHLIIKEFGPQTKHIDGKDNIVADTLSCLSISPTPMFTPEDVEINLVEAAEHFSATKDDLPNHAFPVTYQLLAKEQHKDKTLLKQVQDSAFFLLKEFYGGEQTVSLICHNNRIVIPSTLQKWIVHWYHHILCHPGIKIALPVTC
jgi:hypothetical protein